MGWIIISSKPSYKFWKYKTQASSVHYDISVGCGYRCNKADLWWYPTVMLAVVSSKENVSQYLEQDKQTCHWSKVLALIQKQNIFALIFVVTLILLNLSLRITYCIKKKNSWKTVVTSHDLFSFSFSSPLHSCLYFLTISLSLSVSAFLSFLFSNPSQSKAASAG